jgi:hypothetical protein
MPKNPKCLGDRVFRSPEGGSKVTNADAGRLVQAQQDFEAVGIGQEIKPLRPTSDVNIAAARGRALDVRLLGLVHHRSLPVFTYRGTYTDPTMARANSDTPDRP